MKHSEAGIGQCDNHGMVIFNCSGVGLSSIPSHGHVPNYYQILDLSNNYISNLSKVDFLEGNNITSLLLSNNQISKIKPKAFEHMKNLIKLDLSGNILEGRNMEKNQFFDLVKLEILLMERNPLHLIKKDTFHFMKLFSMKHLDLSHCDISQIEAGAIDVPSLEYLDLSWNKLETFHKESFRMLVYLKTLDLSHNQFTSLDQAPNMPRLQVWILDNNKINNVSMREAMLHLVYHIEHMYIRNNDLSRFNKDSFPWELETLKGIYLDNNPIDCDCKMKWAVRQTDLQGRNFTIPCDAPSKHRGKNLLDIPPDELRCGIPFYKILLLIGVAVIVFLCFTTFLYCIVKWKNIRKSRKSPDTELKEVNGTTYAAVYTKEDDDVTVNVQVSDTTKLLHNDGETEDREIDE